MEFAYDGGGLGKGGTATIYIDGEPAGQGRIEQTEAFLFSADDSPDRVKRWSSRLAAAIIWPIALLSSAGRVRLRRGF